MTKKKVAKVVGNQLIINLDLLPYEEPPPEAPRFVSRVITQWERDDTVSVCTDIVYESKVTGKTYKVPAGFNSDLASVPRIPLAFLLTGGTANRPAVLHDFLYRTGAEDRSTCDAVFAEAMAATGVPAWRRKLMWLGVRIGGRGAHVDTSDSVAPASASAKHEEPQED